MLSSLLLLGEFQEELFQRGGILQQDSSSLFLCQTNLLFLYSVEVTFQGAVRSKAGL